MLAPSIKTPIPGPQSRKIMAELAEVECPAISARRLKRAAAGGGDVPIVWARASGVVVEDVDGNRFLDFTAGFGVMALGYGDPQVTASAEAQLARTTHAMGDAFPGDTKVQLLRTLLRLSRGAFQRVLLGLSGSDAVEAAIKTAILYAHSRQRHGGILAFEGAYHGLSLGALAVTAYSNRFRVPFVAHLNPAVVHQPFPYCYRFPIATGAPGRRSPRPASGNASSMSGSDSAILRRARRRSAPFSSSRSRDAAAWSTRRLATWRASSSWLAIRACRSSSTRSSRASGGAEPGSHTSSMAYSPTW